MKKPKIIRFRCYCVECGPDDRPKDKVLQRAAADSDQDVDPQNLSNPPVAADSIERMLFGA